MQSHISIVGATYPTDSHIAAANAKIWTKKCDIIWSLVWSSRIKFCFCVCVCSFLDMNLFKRTFFWTFRWKYSQNRSLKHTKRLAHIMSKLSRKRWRRLVPAVFTRARKHTQYWNGLNKTQILLRLCECERLVSIPTNPYRAASMLTLAVIRACS